jgi:hypothetical protein
MSEQEGRAPSAIRKSIEPLASWYRSNKPAVKRLVVSQEDYDRLSKATKSTLDRNSFTKIKDVIWWKEFEVVRK